MATFDTHLYRRSMSLQTALTAQFAADGLSTAIVSVEALVAPTVDVPSGGTEEEGGGTEEEGGGTEEEGGGNALVVVVAAVGGVAAVVGGVLCYLKLDPKKRRGVAIKSAAPPSDAV